MKVNQISRIFIANNEAVSPSAHIQIGRKNIRVG
jgi:hypothetical protein